MKHPYKIRPLHVLIICLFQLILPVLTYGIPLLSNQADHSVNGVSYQDGHVNLLIGPADGHLKGDATEIPATLAGSGEAPLITSGVAGTPTITASNTTGTIIACLGSVSAIPYIQQFTVSASNLTGNITANVTAGFEISLNPNTGYATSLVITAPGGTVTNLVVYARAAATTTSGNLIGSVTLVSPGAKGNASLSGVVNSIPTVNRPAPQSVKSGGSTTPVDFTGTATTYNWVNDTPAIGLAASGAGDIPSFTAVNNSGATLVATITVTPETAGTGCTGIPLSFTITVAPDLPPTISATGSPAGLSTIYGTPSSSTTFSVSAVSLTNGILVTPPTGFEVSDDDINFSPAITVGSGGVIAATIVYIRLAGAAPVGNYSGPIQLTSAGAPAATVTMPLSTVIPAKLVVIANDETKIFGTPNPTFTAAYVGFVNNDTATDLTTQPVFSTTALINSPIGQYPISVSGATSPNYTITPIPGVLTVLPSEQSLVIPTAFTPNGDGINDTWNIAYLGYYPNCSVSVFTRWGQQVYNSLGYGIPWDGTYKGTALPTGTYYYVINFKNGFYPLSGYVAIIR